MAPRVWRGKKKQGWEWEEAQPTLPPPCPPGSTPTAAVRGEPGAPAPRLRQGAHTPDAGRRERGPPRNAPAAPARVCAGLRLQARASGDPPMPSPSTLQGQVTPAFRLSEPPHRDPRTTFSRARRCSRLGARRAQGGGQSKRQRLDPSPSPRFHSQPPNVPCGFLKEENGVGVRHCLKSGAAKAPMELLPGRCREGQAGNHLLF